jgi:hypothetical protein
MREDLLQLGNRLAQVPPGASPLAKTPVHLEESRVRVAEQRLPLVDQADTKRRMAKWLGT